MGVESVRFDRQRTKGKPCICKSDDLIRELISQTENITVFLFNFSY